jgi:hypothetical protein
MDPFNLLIFDYIKREYIWSLRLRNPGLQGGITVSHQPYY